MKPTKKEEWRQKIGNLITQSKLTSNEEKFLVADEVVFIVEEAIHQAKEEERKRLEKEIIAKMPAFPMHKKLLSTLLRMLQPVFSESHQTEELC